MTYECTIKNENFTTIPIGGRCGECCIRKDVDTQCKHELCVDPTFKVKYNNKRYLNGEIFQSNYHFLSPMFGHEKSYSDLSNSVKSSSNGHTDNINVETFKNPNITHVNLFDKSDTEDHCATNINHCISHKHITGSTNVGCKNINGKVGL